MNLYRDLASWKRTCTQMAIKESFSDTLYYLLYIIRVHYCLSYSCSRTFEKQILQTGRIMNASVIVNMG